jgi:hypothetical protein
MDGSKIIANQIVRIARKGSNDYLMWVKEMDTLIGRLAFVTKVIDQGKASERFECKVFDGTERSFQYVASSLDSPHAELQLSIDGYAQIKDGSFFEEQEIDLDYWEPHKKAFAVKELHDNTVLLENWGIGDFDDIFEAPRSIVTPLPPIKSAGIVGGLGTDCQFVFIEKYDDGYAHFFYPKLMVTGAHYPNSITPCLHKDVPVYQPWALNARAKLPFILIGKGIDGLCYYTNRAGEIFSNNIMPFEPAPAECNSFWWRPDNEL